jgi:hypothetical protein
MQPTSDSRLLRLLCRLYAVLLSAYPSEFRRQYSGEMRLAFRDQARDAIQRGGASALLPFLMRTSVDWIHSAVRERIATMNEGNRSAAERLANLQVTTPPSSLSVAVILVPVALIVSAVGIMEVQDLTRESTHWTAAWSVDVVTVFRAGIVVVGAWFATIVLLILWLLRPHHWDILKKWRWTRWLMLTLTAGALFTTYLPMIAQRETRALEYLSLPLAVLIIPQTMKRIGIIAVGGVTLMAVGMYNHEWALITVGLVVAVYGFVKPLSESQPATSVFGRRLAFVVLIAVLIGAWLLAGYSGVYITQSVAKVVRHVS